MTISQQLYDKAKEAGKTSGEFLQLAKRTIKADGTKGGTISTGKHKVIFLKEKTVKFIPFQKTEEVEGVSYSFEENESIKTYRRPVFNKEGNLDYFIEKMKDFNYGDTLILEYISKGLNGYIEISLFSNEENNTEEIKIPQKGNQSVKTPTEEDIDEATIPIISEDESISLENLPF